jgi:hypothetical protein
MIRLAGAATAALLIAVTLLGLTSAGAATQALELRLVSETTSTLTLGWDPQAGYGYLFSADGVVVSRTNDPSRSTVKFSKSFSDYEVAVIVKGTTGSWPPPTPPPPPTVAKITQTITSGATLTGVTPWFAVYDADGDGVEDDPGSVQWFVDGNPVRTEVDVPFGDDPTFWPSASVQNGNHTFEVRAISATNVVLATNSVTATVANVTPPPPPPPTGSCDLSATTANFATQVGAAASGQTVCLASGNYGTWSGTNKAITIRAADGATPQMRFSFATGDSGFTLSGMTGMGGAISDGANNITIRGSSFTGTLNISGSSTDGIVLDNNTHNWNVGPSSGGPNAKIYLENSLTGTLGSPSVTIRNSEIRNGDLDGIHFGGGSGYQIVNNTFDNLCDMGANHTDNMQFDTSRTTQVRIAGNYVHANQGCGTQGITSYDHGTDGVLIENNVVDIRRPWGIELYSDVNSIVRHNTVVFYPDSGCDFTGITCGKIDINRKSADPAGVGTQAYDNLASVEFNAGSTGTSDHNVSGNGAIFVGPLTTHDGFLLAPSSPVGRGAARDGSNVGVYANS